MKNKPDKPKTPRYLYKYKSLKSFEDRERTLRIISEGKIFFPMRKELNDPHEWRFDFDTGYSKDDFIEYRQEMERRFGRQNWVIEDLLDDAGKPDRKKLVKWEKFQMDLLHDYYSRLGILCLSERCGSPAMWAHYSNNSGICFEFDFLDTQFHNSDFLWKVAYSSKYPIIKITDLRYGNDDAMKKVLSTKYTDWKYEGEWRLVHREGDKERGLPAPITSIIFGLDFNDGESEEIRKIASSKNISLKKIIKAENKYEYKTEPL